MNTDNFQSIPTPSIRRLPSYLRLLIESRDRGEHVISCTTIAKEFGQQSVQVRKDLAITGVTGRPKVGYEIDVLIKAIEEFLGWDKRTNAFLVGMGNLGSAILNYEGFRAHGLDIVEVFDANPDLYGKRVHGRTIQPFSLILNQASLWRQQNCLIDMGIITVPAFAAQNVADKLVRIGVRAIWNYAPVSLELPEGIVCENVKLSESFAVLTNRMRTAEIQMQKPFNKTYSKRL